MAFGKSINQTFPSDPAVTLLMIGLARRPLVYMVVEPSGSAGARAAHASANRASRVAAMPKRKRVRVGLVEVAGEVVALAVSFTCSLLLPSPCQPLPRDPQPRF